MPGGHEMNRDDGEKAAKLIRRYRQAAGLTQQELASRAGVGVGVVRDLEQGRTAHVRRESAARLSKALGLDGYHAAELNSVAWPHAARTRGARRSRPARGLRLRVLGPVDAWRGGVPVALGTARQRAVLALLALSANVGLHREAIIDALWQDDPPDSAVNVVQAWVGRLRRVLDPGRRPRDPDGLLVSAGTSYRLRLTAREFDLLDVRERASRARAAAWSGDPAAAGALYQSALELWTGEPLADLDVLRGHSAVAELAHLRTTLVLRFAESAFKSGEHDQVLPHLRSLAARDPLNEQAHAQLMIALAGCGQQAAALALFEAIRHRLDDQLGVYPGAELVRAHQTVLRQDLPPVVPGQRTRSTPPARLRTPWKN